MSKIRIIYNNLARKYAILTHGTEHPQFPAEDVQADTPSQFYRTRYGTGSGNGYFYAGATNKYIDFDEGGSELTGTVAVGAYNGNTLATAIAVAMNAAPGKALTYACVYSETDAKFTISAGSNFTIRWYSGTNKATDISAMCGFSDAADDTGAATYTSDYRRINYGYSYIVWDLLQATDVNFCAILNHNFSSDAFIYWHGADDAAFTTNLVTETFTYNAGNMFKFFSSTQTKRYVRVALYDFTNTSSYIQMGPIIFGTYWEPNYTFAKDYTKGKVDDSLIEESHALVEYGQVRPRRKTWSLPFPMGLTQTDADEIVTFFDTVGLVHGFVVCFDYAYPNTNSYFVKNSELIDPTYLHYNNWSWQLALREKL